MQNPFKNYFFSLVYLTFRNMLTRLEQLIFILGYQFYILQRFIGMRCLEDGVKYYAEVHTSFWNSLIHTIFMPFTMLGFYVAIPALWNMTPPQAVYTCRVIMLFYFGAYIQISTLVGILVLAYYTIPLNYADKIYTYIYRNVIQYQRQPTAIIVGLSISIAALGIQEIFGHYMNGDAASRIEAIPNAIIYAPYYSISHLCSKFW
jgi:uncharacterized membrane protein YGL010W